MQSARSPPLRITNAKNSVNAKRGNEPGALSAAVTLVRVVNVTDFENVKTLIEFAYDAATRRYSLPST